MPAPAASTSVGAPFKVPPVSLDTDLGRINVQGGGSYGSIEAGERDGIGADGGSTPRTAVERHG